MKPIAESVSAAMETLAGKLETLTVKKDCYVCATAFEVPAGPMAMYAKTCPACEERLVTEEAEKATRRNALARQERWMTFCPPDYRSIDRARLPNASKLAEVLKWEFGPRGLVLHGDTGRGKTRCAWALLAREVAADRSAACLDSSAGLGYAALYSESAGLVKKWFDHVVVVDILLLDDVFKNKLTDSFEGVVFTLIDQRIQQQRPTILTSNDTGATLAARMTQDRGNPLLRRLREHCIQINF